jgi:tetratricopeptide (TPR) repeat protein
VISNAYLDLGAVFDRQNQPTEAVKAIYQAFRHTEDAMQRMRVLGDLGVKLRDLGATTAARVAFNIVLESDASFTVATNARIEMMEIEAGEGNRFGFERYRRVLDGQMVRMPPSMSVDFHYKLGVCYARFGQPVQARRIWADAMQLAEMHQLNEWFFRIQRVAQEFEIQQTIVEVHPVPTEADFAPVVAEMERGLREYSVLTG